MSWPFLVTGIVPRAKANTSTYQTHQGCLPCNHDWPPGTILVLFQILLCQWVMPHLLHGRWDAVEDGCIWVNCLLRRMISRAPGTSRAWRPGRVHGILGENGFCHSCICKLGIISSPFLFHWINPCCHACVCCCDVWCSVKCVCAGCVGWWLCRAWLSHVGVCWHACSGLMPAASLQSHSPIECIVVSLPQTQHNHPSHTHTTTQTITMPTHPTASPSWNIINKETPMTYTFCLAPLLCLEKVVQLVVNRLWARCLEKVLEELQAVQWVHLSTQPHRWAHLG